MDCDEVIDRLRRSDADLRRLGVKFFGVRVDLVTETGLREGVRPHVEREAIRVT